MANDHNATFGDSLNPKGSFAFNLKEIGTRFKAGVGQGFRAPDFAELYTSMAGNPDLKPEESLSCEVGLEQRLSALKARVELTYFYNSFENLIDMDFETFRFANIGEATTEGLEFSLAFQPLDMLYIRGEYTGLWTEDKSTGEELAMRPKHSGALLVELTPLDGLVLTGTAYFVGKHLDSFQYVNIHGEIITDQYASGYARADLAGSYRILENAGILEELTGFVKIENITDEQYDEAGGFPMPGISVMAGLEAVF